MEKKKWRKIKIKEVALSGKSGARWKKWHRITKKWHKMEEVGWGTLGQLALNQRRSTIPLPVRISFPSKHIFLHPRQSTKRKRHGITSYAGSQYRCRWVGRLGASHSKSFEFLLVPLTQCGGTNFKALTIFLFPKIGHLPFFSSTILYPHFHTAIGVSFRF